MTAGSYLLPRDRRWLNEVAMAITATYVADAYSEDVPSQFYSTVVAEIEQHLEGGLDDLDLPELSSWRGEMEAA